MIRPQRNASRELIGLGGLWRLAVDPDDHGEARGWQHGLDAATATHWVAVPGSIQEQLETAGLMAWQGAVWFETECHVPAGWSGRRVFLDLPSAEYHARIWVDGAWLGDHDLPFLPGQYDLGPLASPGARVRISIRLDGRLRDDEPLMGIASDDYARERRPKDEVYPPIRGDFYPYLGLHRTPGLGARPAGGLETLAVDGDWRVDGHGVLGIRAHAPGASALALCLRAPDGGVTFETDAALVDGALVAHWTLPAITPWRVGAGALYRLELACRDASGAVFDHYAVDVGFRNLGWDHAGVYLNGERLTLRGVGMHEDFAVLGKGQALAVTVRDLGLVGWLGANCLRTAHYPHAEDTLDLADRLGILVISEAACVNLDFRQRAPALAAHHARALEAQIARDRGHPSVIAWSLANEPGYLGEPEYREHGDDYWRTLTAVARAADATRPLMVANVEYAGRDDPAFAHTDIVAINRYWGWYTMPGQLQRAAQRLKDELDHLAARYRKPILISEFGADAVAGAHALGPQLFTEEYQAQLIEAYLEVIDAHPAALGGLVWNFADFRTAQHHRRVIHNLKGVFTRERQPKAAAFALRRRWTGAR